MAGSGPNSAKVPANTQLQKVVVEAIPPEANTLPTRPTDSVYGLGDSVLDTPRAIYQVSKDQLLFDPINQVSDLARYSPSVTNSSSQGIGGAPYIRGYTAEVYQDGFRIGRFFRPFDPTTSYENLDIVTGPASVVYGPSSKTSGYLDWTTKKPYFDRQHTQVNLVFGSWASGGQGYSDFSQQVDNSGPINKDLAYRVVYKQNEDEGYFTGGKNDYEHVYAALSWLPTKEISVDWNFDFGNYDYALLRGWNRITQNLVDNGTYTAGVATPVFRGNITPAARPCSMSPRPTTPMAAARRRATTSSALRPTRRPVRPRRTRPTAPFIPGSIPPARCRGFVLRPGNVSNQQIYPYQGRREPG